MQRILRDKSIRMDWKLKALLLAYELKIPMNYSKGM
jgi:hypothetical protein